MRKRELLMIDRMDVPPEIETDWNNWYDTKHIPDRLNVESGFLSARRFVAIEGEPKYLTLYDLASIDALRSKAYLELRDREASLPKGSFEAMTHRLPNYSLGLYKQIYPMQGEYRIPNTEIILLLGYDVPSDREEELAVWYNAEHMPAMAQLPGVVTASRFAVVKPKLPPRKGGWVYSPKFVVLYDLENEGVLQSDDFLKQSESRRSRWTQSWFNVRYRIVARRIYPKP